MMTSKGRIYMLTARCKITNGNRQALNMAWATLAQFIHMTECYLSNFPGLYYQVRIEYCICFLKGQLYTISSIFRSYLQSVHLKRMTSYVFCRSVLGWQSIDIDKYSQVNFWWKFCWKFMVNTYLRLVTWRKKVVWALGNTNSLIYPFQSTLRELSVLVS